MYSEQNDFSEKLELVSKIESALRLIGYNKEISEFDLALEIGGSGGLLAGLISTNDVKVICTDIVNMQLKYNGEFPRLLKEKFFRNGFELDLGKIEFHTADAQNLLYANDVFDFAFSLNALEHIPNPLKAIEEISRVLKAGGAFYASFDPVWTADSGSHFIHLTKEPWLHLLITDEEYCARMKNAGAADEELIDYRVAMNRLPSSFYLDKMNDLLADKFSTHVITNWTGCVSDDHYSHPNLAMAKERTGLSVEHLLIRGFSIIAVK